MIGEHGFEKGDGFGVNSVFIIKCIQLLFKKIQISGGGSFNKGV